MIERKMEFIEQEHILQQQPVVYVMAPNATAALADQEKIERKGGMRLTNAMKASILEKVYDFKFKKTGEKLDATELKLSHRAMIAAFGTATLDALAKIGPPYAYCDHHEDGTKRSGELLEQWKGTKVAWVVGSLGHQYSLYVKDPLPGHVGYGHFKHFKVKDGKLAEDIMAWHQSCSDWTQAKREMQLKVNAVLNSVTTFNSLQKTWPGGERFYKSLPLDFPFRNQVPAVRVDELNSALGI